MKKALTGGAAAAEALRQINPDVMPAYPITPQTPIIETFAKIEAQKKVDTEIITVESEHSAISACVGSSAAGARTVTATSSQGLALMNEILYIASGMRLPILMVISMRALSAPINIHGDHSDVMGARDTGWIQLISENVQEVYDNILMGMKLAEKAYLPVMVGMDGFVTSHSVEVLETLSDKVAKDFVGKFQPREPLLDMNNPVSYGPVGLPDSYFEFKIEQAQAMQDVFKFSRQIQDEFQAVSQRVYDFVETYRMEDARQAIVVMGSTAGTAKEVVDKLRAQGEKVGLIKIRMFRPFPYKEIKLALASVKSVAVMERVMPFGSVAPLYGEILAALQPLERKPIMASYIYGLGGRDIFARQIEKVFKELKAEKINSGIKYIQ